MGFDDPHTCLTARFGCPRQRQPLLALLSFCPRSPRISGFPHVSGYDHLNPTLHIPHRIHFYINCLFMDPGENSTWAPCSCRRSCWEHMSGPGRTRTKFYLPARFLGSNPWAMAHSHYFPTSSFFLFCFSTVGSPYSRGSHFFFFFFYIYLFLYF